jgi:hypothetical protein
MTSTPMCCRRWRLQAGLPSPAIPRACPHCRRFRLGRSYTANTSLAKPGSGSPGACHSALPSRAIAPSLRVPQRPPFPWRSLTLPWRSLALPWRSFPPVTESCPPVAEPHPPVAESCLPVAESCPPVAEPDPPTVEPPPGLPIPPWTRPGPMCISEDAFRPHSMGADTRRGRWLQGEGGGPWWRRRFSPPRPSSMVS